MKDRYIKILGHLFFMKLSVVIPVYNERDTVEKLISEVRAVKIGDIKKEIIVVDDFSTDGTRDILKGVEGIGVFFHKRNLGKGAALKTGIAKTSGDVILVQDADLEYSPNDYPKLIGPIVAGKAKIVYGSRLLRKKNHQGRWWFYAGGIAVTKFTNLLYRSRLTDEPTCYKVFHKDLKDVLLKAEGNRFEWEPEITAKFLRKGYKIHEVPISYEPRTDGKKIGFGDGIQALWTLLKWRFKDIS